VNILLLGVFIYGYFFQNSYYSVSALYLYWQLHKKLEMVDNLDCISFEQCSVSGIQQLTTSLFCFQEDLKAHCEVSISNK